MKIQPNESITVSGYVRKISRVDTAVTESTQGVSSRVGVCPQVIKLDTPGIGQRIPVWLYIIFMSQAMERPIIQYGFYLTKPIHRYGCTGLHSVKFWIS